MLSSSADVGTDKPEPDRPITKPLNQSWKYLSIITVPTVSVRGDDDDMMCQSIILLE